MDSQNSRETTICLTNNFSMLGVTLRRTIITSRGCRITSYYRNREELRPGSYAEFTFHNSPEKYVWIINCLIKVSVLRYTLKWISPILHVQFSAWNIIIVVTDNADSYFLPSLFLDLMQLMFQMMNISRVKNLKNKMLLHLKNPDFLCSFLFYSIKEQNVFVDI